MVHTYSRGGLCAAALLGCVALAGVLPATPARSACAPDGAGIPSGANVVCTGTETGQVGNGTQNNVTVNILAGASVVSSNLNGTFQLQNNNVVTNNGTFNGAAFFKTFTGSNNLVINNGTAILNGGEFAVSNLGQNTFINNGTMTGNNAEFAFGGGNGSGGNTAINNGTINFTNGSGFFMQGGTAINNGTITVGGGNGTAVYTVFFNNGPNTFNNNGVAVATGGTFSLQARNTGTATVNNAGTLDGLISMTGGGGNVINNSGLITITDPSAALAAGNYNIDGSFNQTGSGTLGVRLNGAGVADTMTLTGAASLGGKLSAFVQPGLYGSSTLYTGVITAATVSGQFAQTQAFAPGGTTPLAFFTLTPTYNAASVDLTLNRTGFGSVAGETVNERNVGTALNSVYSTSLTGAAATLFSNLLQATSVKALDQLDGEVATGAERAVFQLTNEFLGLMLDPFVNGRGNVGGGGYSAIGFAPEEQTKLPPDVALAYDSILAKTPALPFDQRWTAWGTGFGGANNANGDPAVVGSNNIRANTFGFAAGADYHVTPSTVVGFALAGAGTNWGLANAMGTGRSDAVQVGAYGISWFGAAYLAGALSFSDHFFTTNRSAFGAPLTANFMGQGYGARLEGGYRVGVLPVLGVTPYGAVQFQAFNTPAYNESDPTGSGAALNFASMNSTDVRSELGSRVDAPTVAFGKPLVIYGRAAWAHDSVSNPALSAAFQALPGGGFTVFGAPVPQNSALTTLGAQLYLTPQWTLLAKFDGEFATGSQTYAGSGTVRYTW
jgi:uncharacterized protein with beta-barrel porin domain